MLWFVLAGATFHSSLQHPQTKRDKKFLQPPFPGQLNLFSTNSDLVKLSFYTMKQRKHACLCVHCVRHNTAFALRASAATSGRSLNSSCVSTDNYELPILTSDA